MGKYNIKMTQCDTGRYNMLSDEESLSVYVVIKDEDGKTAEIDGVRAILYYSGDVDEKEDFEYAFPDNIDFIFGKAFGYGKRVYGSTDYKKQCLAFLKLYTENFEEIKEEYTKDRKNQIEQEIENLTSELESISLSNCSAESMEVIEKEATMYDRWASEKEKELSDLKEGTESWTKIDAKIKEYKDEAKKLRKYIK